MKPITEQNVTIQVAPPQKDVNKAMPIFYNPVMQSHRNITLALLHSIANKQLKCALPLAGSGIRALRMLKELPLEKIASIHLNDKKEAFKEYFTEQLKHNQLSSEKISLTTKDANIFLLEAEGFDYIDIDPFGSPNPFLATAVARISRKGILAITATDTAALTGTYPKTSLRKYWAKTIKTPLLHESGLRILIRKVQLQGLQFGKALIPILSYHKDHYFRVFFRAYSSKEKCNGICKQHQFLLYNTKTAEYTTSKFNQEEGYDEFLGPLWVGSLQDKDLLQKIITNNAYPQETSFLTLLHEELDIVGFHDLHALAKKYKKEPPKMEPLLQALQATRTHFAKNGIKTKKSLQEVLEKW